MIYKYILSVEMMVFKIYYCASIEFKYIEIYIMGKYKSEQISLVLKEARENKGLSQRELAAKSGVPQGHISKIENGAVDLRVSSLIALARVLDMELTLVPRKNVSAVKSIIRSGESNFEKVNRDAMLAAKELARIKKTINSLPKIPDYAKEVAQLNSRIRELGNLKIPKTHFSELEKINKALNAMKLDVNLDVINKSILKADKLRNVLAHKAVKVPNLKIPKPAYSLDEDD
jgi:transcriptional regulator with XRE-family HTH domain